MLPSPGMVMRGSDNEMCQDINGEFRGFAAFGHNRTRTLLELPVSERQVRGCVHHISRNVL